MKILYLIVYLIGTSYLARSRPQRYKLWVGLKTCDILLKTLKQLHNGLRGTSYLIRGIGDVGSNSNFSLTQSSPLHRASDLTRTRDILSVRRKLLTTMLRALNITLRRSFLITARRRKPKEAGK